MTESPHGIEWDGNDHVGRYTDDARQADEEPNKRIDHAHVELPHTAHTAAILGDGPLDGTETTAQLVTGVEEAGTRTWGGEGEMQQALDELKTTAEAEAD